jgi:hypothetical protein
MAKYDALAQALATLGPVTAKVSFTQLDRIVDGLPDSAIKYREWWSNERNGSHVQAHSWMSAGYMVSEVQLGDYVVFVRSATQITWTQPSNCHNDPF